MKPRKRLTLKTVWETIKRALRTRSPALRPALQRFGKITMNVLNVAEIMFFMLAT